MALRKLVTGAGRTKYTPEDAVKKIQDYVAHCEASKRRVTLAGLAVFMQVTKDTVHAYCDRWKTFAHEYALLLARAEDELAQGKTAMDIFLLKASFGYQDKVVVESEAKVQTSGEIKIEFTTVPDVDVSKYDQAETD